MPSGASVAQREAERLASLTFFLDHQIGRYQVAEMLRSAGAKVEVDLDHFPGDMLDVVVTDSGVENFTDFLPSELGDIEKLVGQGGVVQKFPPVSEQELKRRK